MKRMLCIFVAAALLLCVPVQAVVIENTNAYWMTGVHTDRLNNDAEAQAEMLLALGLFKGTDKGFELERNMTRAEAAVMLVRFLGAEQKVLAGSWSHPFTDVPVWASPYVGWLYQSGLTKGVSKTQYAPAQRITLAQYATFLSRAISGTDDWESVGVATADEVELWDRANGMFTRAAAVGLTTRALSITYTKNGNYTYSMAQFFVDKEMFTRELLLEAAWGVLPPDYPHLNGDDSLSLVIAGVEIAKTPVGGLVWKTGEDSTLPYFFAAAREGNHSVLYRIDCRTMECTALRAKELIEDELAWQYTYIITINGMDYLFEYSYKAGQCTLLRYDGKDISVARESVRFSGDEVWPSLKYNFFTVQDAFVISGNDSYIRISGDEITEKPLPVGTRILGYDGDLIVTQRVTEEATTISCLDAATGTGKDTYSVEQDLRNSDYDIPRTVQEKNTGMFYGEAGMYVLDSTSGRLKQMTARPVLDVTGFRNDGRPIILTHDLGKRVYSGFGEGGDQIILLEADGTERVLLGNDPAHRIGIAGFTDHHGTSTIGFCTASDVGMQHFDQYYYVLLPSYNAPTGVYDGGQPTIIVTGFTAGRPEVEEEGYEAAHVRAEQSRLDALGYGNK